MNDLILIHILHNLKYCKSNFDIRLKNLNNLYFINEMETRFYHFGYKFQH
jgi:hypothetical protein